jgi:hypothetical protein
LVLTFQLFFGVALVKFGLGKFIIVRLLWHTVCLYHLRMGF